jgi:hypothetical protein
VNTVAIVIALIALAGSILSTVVTVFAPPALQARRESSKVLATYRDPLLGAAYELQARLHNILTNQFVEKYLVGNKADKQDAAMQSTLYVFAQYFGWGEVIRREVQLLRFSSSAETREVGRILRDIIETFLTEDHGPQFMIWRVEQRGFGEQMIDAGTEPLRCLGYASFLENREKLARWLAPLERDLLSITDEGRVRLVKLQHLLLALVNRLDKNHLRYPFEMNAS